MGQCCVASCVEDGRGAHDAGTSAHVQSSEKVGDGGIADVDEDERKDDQLGLRLGDDLMENGLDMQAST